MYLVLSIGCYHRIQKDKKTDRQRQSMIQSPAGGEDWAREIGFLTSTREPTAGQKRKSINKRKQQGKIFK